MTDDQELAWKAEERRQVQLLSEAIEAAIQATAATFGTVPMMNALAGALVTVEAGMLAGIADARHRKTMRAMMDRARPRALAAARQQTTSHCMVHIIGDPRN